MWKNSGNNATRSWKRDVLQLPVITWGLDKNSCIWWKTNKIYFLGNPSPKTWNNQTHDNLSVLTQICRNLRHSLNHCHDKSHDDFNVSSVDYSDPTRGGREVPASEMGLHTSLRVHRPLNNNKKKLTIRLVKIHLKFYQ